jgi:predicted acetyltransferase
MVPWNPCDLGEIQTCYHRLATSTNGLIDRTDRWWRRRVLAPGDRPLYGYLARASGQVGGYVVFEPEPARGNFSYSYSLACHDLVWLDHAAAGQLLDFAAGHRSVGVDLVWVGSIEEPLFNLVDFQEIQILESSRWMVRLIDVPKALEARGYPQGVRAAVTLDVADPDLPGNHQVMRFEVAEGRARVTPGGGGGVVRLDIGTLAAVYTGWLSARDAVRTGRLEGDRDDVAALEASFGGPKPWMLDRF